MFYGGHLIVEAPGTKDGGWFVLVGAGLVVLGFWLFGLAGIADGAGGPAYG